MSDQVTLDGKEYISSKRASELSGYTQDYIGQLSRKGLIDARRVSGLWYVLLESLQSYKTAAEAYKPEPPLRTRETADPESLISFDGKGYVSAAKAAKLTGYHQDYVGQLARAGTVLSRQVGNRWYVDREALVAHKKEKDALLAAVQSDAVGLSKSEKPEEVEEPEFAGIDNGPYLTYTRDERDLLPSLHIPDDSEENPELPEEVSVEEEAVPVPVRVISPGPRIEVPQRVVFTAQRTSPRQSKRGYGALVAATLTIVVVVAVGFSTFSRSSTYAVAPGASDAASGAAALGYTERVRAGFERLGAVLEYFVVPELVYRRR